MKRFVAEWGWMLVVVSPLAFASLWGASYFVERSQSCLKLGKDLFLLVRDGRVCLFSELDTNSNDPRPLIVNPRTVIAPKVIDSGKFTIPGLAFHSCSFADGLVVWSLDVSLLVLTALGLLVAMTCVVRLQWIRAQRRRHLNRYF